MVSSSFTFLSVWYKDGGKAVAKFRGSGRVLGVEVALRCRGSGRETLLNGIKEA